jgi:hypothetical protein
MYLYQQIIAGKTNIKEMDHQHAIYSGLAHVNINNHSDFNSKLSKSCTLSLAQMRHLENLVMKFHEGTVELNNKMKVEHSTPEYS